MRKARHIILLVMTAALLFGLAAHVHPARADEIDDLLNQSNNNPDSQKALKEAKQKDPSNGASSMGGSTTPTPTAGGTSGPAIVPAATPCVVDSFTVDPPQLQSGTRFTLTLTVKNPGTDDAEDVVVQIGPSSETGWGGDDEFAVLGSGSAKYVGTIGGGSSNSSAVFQLMANPQSPGGVRSIPVKMTWKSQGYQHEASEVVGVLVNSLVSLDTTMGSVGAPPVEKQPFQVALGITNETSKTVKSVTVTFSGSGATPSSATSMSVGDILPGTTRQIQMKYTGPIAGRAKLMANISYVDDFGDVRTVPVLSWTKIMRPQAVDQSDDSSDSGGPLDQLVAALGALLGVSG